MPKPIYGDNGSGMHCHQSIWKGGKPVFAGNKYADLSETCLSYIAGIIKHAKAINAFTNPTTNSYKRLVPGFEAPVLLAYSARNRSASCRIPYTTNPKAKRVEVRFPDPLANPYLGFAAMLMAGLDGVKNKLDPGPAMDKDLYDLPPKELKKIPTVCGSLREALANLDKDREFLKAGGVFDDDFIDSYIELKMTEVIRFEHTPHPVEYVMYYSGVAFSPNRRGDAATSRALSGAPFFFGRNRVGTNLRLPKRQRVSQTVASAPHATSIILKNNGFRPNRQQLRILWARDFWYRSPSVLRHSDLVPRIRVPRLRRDRINLGATQPRWRGKS